MCKILLTAQWLVRVELYAQSSTVEAMRHLPAHICLQGASKAKSFANDLSRGPREYLVAVRSEGQFIGEMALFATAAVRCASVRAKGPVRVKIVPGEELIDISAEVSPSCLLSIVQLCVKHSIADSSNNQL